MFFFFLAQKFVGLEEFAYWGSTIIGVELKNGDGDGYGMGWDGIASERFGIGIGNGIKIGIGTWTDRIG